MNFNVHEFLRLRREQRAEDRRNEAYIDLCDRFGEEPAFERGLPKKDHMRALCARERAEDREAGKRAAEFRKLVRSLSC